MDTEQINLPDRALPVSLDAEKAVLGAILAHAELWATVATMMVAGDFFRDAHRRIYEAMSRLVQHGSAIDFVLLREELRRSGEEEEVGGPAYLASLVDGMPARVNVGHYVGIVQEKARLRRAIAAANDVVARAYAAEPCDEVIESGVRNLLRQVSVGSNGAVSIGDAAARYASGLDEPGRDGLSTGLRDLDMMLAGGLRRGALSMIAARPGHGKTTLVSQLAEYAARTGTAAAIFSLEMSAEALVEASLARHAQIDAHRLRARTSRDVEMLRLSDAVGVFQDLPVYIVEHARTLTQVQAWTARLIEQHQVGLIGVDYIQLLADPLSRDRRQEIDTLARGFRRMAQDLKVVVVVLSQLSRASEHRTDKRPHLADMMESSGLEAAADLVLLLFRPELYRKRKADSDEEGLVEIIIAKQRAGPTGVVKAAFVREQLRFADLTARIEEDR